MAHRIQILTEQVANQIAAGEVIERPASALKELVENAIDAGATQIEIHTRGGGRSLIQVTDNGCGMSRDDALLCLERHATSKLRVSDDLRTLQTFGFRGEALPSIASVSKFRLRTREPEMISGTELIIDGGKLSAVQEVGMAPGTQVEVRSLFYNLPARRKFLRTEATESAHLQHQITLAALSRPDIGWVVVHDDNPPVRWAMGQDLDRRCSTIFGETWRKLMIPVNVQSGEFWLRGLIGQPGTSRANRAEEIIFVNHRPVESRTIHYGLMEGYHNALMRGRYPVCVLFLDMNPEGVDVNIHPAKREVKFHDDARVRSFLVRAISSVLREFQATPVAVSLSTPAPEPILPPLPAAVTTPLPLEASSPVTWAPRSASPTSIFTPAPTRPEPEAHIKIKLLGCLGALYLVGQGDEGMVLIDQHAAHERVLFEKMLKRIAKQEIESQRLLLPVTVEFPPRESHFLQAQIEGLNLVGVGIHSFGSNSFMIDALPPMVKTQNVEAFIRTLVVELQEEGGETRKERRVSEEAIAKKVCRQSVKANDRLHPHEWEHLVKDLLACDFPYTCPHGRPTMIQISYNELERKFGRAG